MYQVLYRKYRPKVFSDVYGQEHVTSTLLNEIKENRISHAYLFTGSRGTGKTSCAKILAKAVNCENSVNGEPCNECEVCRGLDSGSIYDVVEIDAASNNGVDNIRDLREEANYTPSRGRYRVYIIDEVHMLSTGAFNALLKTLEEPPSHAIFILATTEIHQIPATILSRCLRFDFRLVPNVVIAKRIRFIFDDIGVRYEKEAVDLIANAGAGSVRDALSIADMCVSYCNFNVTYNGVLEVLGTLDPQKLQNFAKSIADGDTNKALHMVAEFCDSGKNISLLAQDVATLFRNVLYIKNCTDAKNLLALPESIFENLSEMANVYSSEKCMSIMRIMSKLEGEFRYSTQHRILFESAVVLACCGFGDNTKIDELQLRVAKLEKNLANQKRNFESAPVVADARQVWIRVASALRQSGFTLLALSTQDAKFDMTDDEFFVRVADKTTLGLLSDKNNRDALNRAFASVDSHRTLKIDTALHLDEDKALPYIKEMFGNLVEIKNK